MNQPTHDKPLNHSKGPFNIRDRGSIVRTWLEDGVSKESFPNAIDCPAPPFALGSIIALVASNFRGASNAPLLSLADTAPHLCEDRDCPGDINRRKIEAYDMAVAAIEKASRERLLTVPELCLVNGLKAR